MILKEMQVRIKKKERRGGGIGRQVQWTGQKNVWLSRHDVHVTCSDTDA